MMADPVNMFIPSNIGEVDVGAVRVSVASAPAVRKVPPIRGFLGKGIGLRTCFFDMVEPTSTVEDPTITLGGKTLAVDLKAWLEDPTGRSEHKNPHLKFLVSAACFLLRRNVRLICVLAHAASPAVEDAVPVLAALGLSWLRLPPGDASPSAACVALESSGDADGVISSTPEVFLYGARRVFKATSFCSLREGRMLEYRADALHPALGDGGTDPELAHRRIVAFAALVGCDRSTGGLRLSPSRAVEFVRSVPDGVDPLDHLRDWADAPAAAEGPSPTSVAAAGVASAPSRRPLTDAAEGAYVKGASLLREHCAKAVVARRPNLEMLLEIHEKKPLFGFRSTLAETAAALRRDGLELCARVEVVAPGLLPPHPLVDARDLAAGTKPPTHVYPIAFAPSSKGRGSKVRKLRDELADGGAVRVLWRIQGGRSFSTVESKAAFTAVYPMLKQKNWANTYQLRGMLGM